MTAEEKPYQMIENDKQLAALVERIRASETVALDTEADSLHHYYEKLCLVQVGLGKHNYIVDPLSDLNLSDFFKALADKPLILHAADYDLRMMRQSVGFRPRGEVFDTMIAAQLLGYPQIGLAAMVEKVFGVTLGKQKQKSDWSSRPLSDAFLSYASDDTRYLERLAAKLRSELEKKGRLEWHRESCQRVVRATGEAREKDPEHAWRIKGTGKIRERRTLAFVRQIWNWREKEAQATDRPPFKVFGNSQLLELAEWAASRQKVRLDYNDPAFSLETAMGEKKKILPRNCRGRRLEALQKALQKAHEQPAEKWPDFRKGEIYVGPQYSGKVDAIRKECARIAAELEIEPSVLASKAVIEEIVRAKAATLEEMRKCSSIMNWQAKLIKPVIQQAFQTQT